MHWWVHQRDRYSRLEEAFRCLSDACLSFWVPGSWEESDKLIDSKQFSPVSHGALVLTQRWERKGVAIQGLNLVQDKYSNCVYTQGALCALGKEGGVLHLQVSSSAASQW